MRRLSRYSLAFAFAVGTTAACSDPKKDGGDGDSDDATNMPLDGSLRDAQSGMDARTRNEAGPAKPDSSNDGALANEEVCDGIDNDGDGEIDNIDVAMDGICDCLKIATLGAPGSAGVGDVFGAWLDARSNNGAVNLRDMTLTQQLLSQFQVVVVQDLHDQRAYQSAEIDALEAWVRAGGGLLTLTGYFAPSERTNVNAILQRFGVSYGADLLLKKGAAKSVPVRTWVKPHPVTEGISAVGADAAYQVNGTGTVLASETSVTMMRVQEVGMGHLIAWGDEWITYDSEWKNSSDYQVEQLWRNMLKWLTVERVCQVPVLFL